LLVGAVNAELEIKVTPVHDTIDWNGTAIYDVTVGGVAEQIRLRPATFEWGTVRFDDTVLFPGTSTRVYVQPPSDVLIGNYAVEILALVYNNADVRTSDFLKLTVVSELPHVQPNWGFAREQQPGKVDVNLVLENAGTTPIDGITAKLESTLLPAPVDLNIGKMNKGEAREVWDTTLDIPLDTPAKNYDLTLSIFKDGKLVTKYINPVTILEKKSVKIDVFTDPKFLGTTYTAVIKNIGNTVAVDNYVVTVPSWQRFFIEGKLKPSVTTADGTSEAAWAYDLPIGMSMTLVYTISFMPLLALLISLLLLFYVGFWYMGQGLGITKELVHAERALKVRLHVKNNSTKPQRNVIVEDTIPTPLTLVREFATLAPSAIKKSDGAVKVLWKFDVIWPHEEKILSYNLKSALAVHGTVMLPAARIRKKGEIGETPKVFLSNRIAVQGKIRATGAEETYK
jgi:hypothetical protein